MKISRIHLSRFHLMGLLSMSLCCPLCCHPMRKRQVHSVSPLHLIIWMWTFRWKPYPRMFLLPGRSPLHTTLLYLVSSHDGLIPYAWRVRNLCAVADVLHLVPCLVSMHVMNYNITWYDLRLDRQGKACLPSKLTPYPRTLVKVSLA